MSLLSLLKSVSLIEILGAHVKLRLPRRSLSCSAPRTLQTHHARQPRLEGEIEANSTQLTLEQAALLPAALQKREHLNMVHEELATPGGASAACCGICSNRPPFSNRKKPALGMNSR
jgi:hypothetical protein